MEDGRGATLTPFAARRVRPGSSKSSKIGSSDDAMAHGSIAGMLMDDGGSLKRGPPLVMPVGPVLPAAPEDSEGPMQSEASATGSASRDAEEAGTHPTTPSSKHALALAGKKTAGDATRDDHSGLDVLRSPAEKLRISLDAARTVIFEGAILHKVPFNKPGVMHSRQFQVVMDGHYQEVAMERERDRLRAMRNHGWPTQGDARKALGPPRQRRVSARKRQRKMVRADAAMTAGIQWGEGGWTALSLTWQEPKRHATTSVFSFGASAATRSVGLLEAREVALGHSTEAMKSQKARGADPLPPADRCLSLLCGSRTVDLAVRCAQRALTIVASISNRYH